MSNWFIKVKLPSKQACLQGHTKTTRIPDVQNNKVFSLGKRSTLLCLLYKCRQQINPIDIYSLNTSEPLGCIRILDSGGNTELTIMDCESETIFILEYFHTKNVSKAMQVVYVAKMHSFSFSKTPFCWKCGKTKM